MVVTAALHVLGAAPASGLTREATASIGLEEVIVRMEAEPSLQLALQVDPWLALACYDLIHRPAPHHATTLDAD